MLNELQSAVDKQDDSIFLIKYKNILEERCIFVAINFDIYGISVSLWLQENTTK